MLNIPVRRNASDIPLPERARPGDAGVDLRAAVEVEIPPAGGRALVPTGLFMAVPEGYGGFVLPRSGLAVRHGVTCLNAPGLIDSGYRGEIQIVLLNTDPTTPFTVRKGDRIAQLVVLEVPELDWHEVDELDDTERGHGGFGHSGV
ncbi:MAG TPA: dUTP diphosphatase [Acidimicrobiales bacterium]|nr:dUTP diphosphatase [Acidimicrobiales bacterium]